MKNVLDLQEKLIDYCAQKSSRVVHLKALTKLGVLNTDQTYDECAKKITDYLDTESNGVCTGGKEKALVGLGLTAPKRIGVTRYVIDVEYELQEASGHYGNDCGNSDCGTVISGGRFMTDAILKTTSINGNKPLKARTVAYRTDVEMSETWTQDLLK